MRLPRVPVHLIISQWRLPAYLVFSRPFRVSPLLSSTLPRIEPDRLFHALDSNKSGRISFDDFVVGLAVCCRGTLEEKMRFLFGVYDMNEARFHPTLVRLYLFESAAWVKTLNTTILLPFHQFFPFIFPSLCRVYLFLSHSCPPVLSTLPE